MDTGKKDTCITKNFEDFLHDVSLMLSSQETLSKVILAFWDLKRFSFLFVIVSIPGWCREQKELVSFGMHFLLYVLSTKVNMVASGIPRREWGGRDWLEFVQLWPMILHAAENDKHIPTSSQVIFGIRRTFNFFLSSPNTNDHWSI